MQTTPDMWSKGNILFLMFEKKKNLQHELVNRTSNTDPWWLTFKFRSYFLWKMLCHEIKYFIFSPSFYFFFFSVNVRHILNFSTFPTTKTVKAWTRPSATHLPKHNQVFLGGKVRSHRSHVQTFADQKGCKLRVDPCTKQAIQQRPTMTPKRLSDTLSTMLNMNWSISTTGETKFVELVLNCKQEKLRHLINIIDFSNRMDKDHHKIKKASKREIQKMDAEWGFYVYMLQS